MANATMLSHLIFMMTSVVMVSWIRSLKFLAVLKDVLRAYSSASADDSRSYLRLTIQLSSSDELSANVIPFPQEQVMNLPRW